MFRVDFYLIIVVTMQLCFYTVTIVASCHDPRVDKKLSVTSAIIVSENKFLYLVLILLILTPLIASFENFFLFFFSSMGFETCKINKLSKARVLSDLLWINLKSCRKARKYETSFQ